MSFFDYFSVIKDVIGGIKAIWSYLSKWLHERMLNEKEKQVTEGLDERDSRKLEEALGHESPGDRSNLPGVRIRRRKDKSTSLVD